ncbi:S-adenosylmethionine synthetase [Oscillibacter valericigenes Sjm18-20]|nr:S-adenosylmethionine synthetase [Oscillibacter valericigenes Sjm18-20]
MDGTLITCESVTEGHPDKVCDQISDGILDAYLRADPQAHVAVETMVSQNTVMIAGEVTSREQINLQSVARGVIRKIGYVRPGLGFDADSCLILTNVHSQSPDIAMGVNKETAEQIGGGDQGIMYGYACRETPELMPLPCVLAHRLCMKLAEVRKSGELPWLLPDGKSQVTIRYDGNGRPGRITSVVLSAQHEDIGAGIEAVREKLYENVIQKVIDPALLDGDAKIHINPTGRFVVGGPAGDVGLTGRKIMVDTYGGIGKHGGGAFSGKDPTKVDRTAAYMCRYVAKNIVSAKLAERCEVSVAFVIGGIQAEAVAVNTFGTGALPDDLLTQLVLETFSFSVADMIRTLDLRQPQFQKTAAYGHFGREGFGWEKTDRAERFRARAEFIGKRLEKVPKAATSQTPKEAAIEHLIWKAARELEEEREHAPKGSGAFNSTDAFAVKDSPLIKNCKPCSQRYWEQRRENS